MKNIELERLQSNFIDLEKQFDDLDINEFEERLLNIQDEVIAFKEMCLPAEVNSFDSLLKRIKTIKKENKFHEEQSEKDRMFPNLNNTLLNDDLQLEDEFEDDF
jgi:Ni,Fe-hydrogenase III large subunit